MPARTPGVVGKLNKLSTCHGRCARSESLGPRAFPYGCQSMETPGPVSLARPGRCGGSGRTSLVWPPLSSSLRSLSSPLVQVAVKSPLEPMPHPLSRSAPWISGELEEDVVVRAAAATKRGKVSRMFEPEFPADSTTSPTCSCSPVDCILVEHGIAISSNIFALSNFSCMPCGTC